MQAMEKKLRISVFALAALLCLLLPRFTNAEDEDTAYTIETKSLPVDLNFMPSLSNGQLGYTVFGDAIYVNGIYNGVAGDSRRARLPNWLNLSLIAVQRPNGQELLREAPEPVYQMRLRDGYFRWCSEADTTSVALHLHVEQRSYAHRHFDRALVYELLVRRDVDQAKEPLLLTIAQKTGGASTAFDFMDTNGVIVDIDQMPNNKGLTVLKGVTRSKEHPDFQRERRAVYIVFSEVFGKTKTLTMAADAKELRYHYVVTIDEQEAVARKEMNDILQLEADHVLQTHLLEWQQFWQQFAIEVKDNNKLAQIINAGIFYMACSLPASNTNQPTAEYFGLSPTGLGRGQLDDDYEGHNFWDTEIWMLPVVTQLSTRWAQTLLSYRLNHLVGAQYNANRTGYKGARFPWESAYTGTEVTNPCCPEVAAQEIHISADIVFALQQHYAVTHPNHVWLCESAWPLAREIASFLESRVVWDMGTQQYHIRGVMGPDEDHLNVTDSVYTNVVFKIALEFASFVEQQCAASLTNHSANWLKIAQGLCILYDPLLDYHPQHLRYPYGEQIKQADVILLGYPLQFAMNASTRLNDLSVYENATRSSGPAMTWSMFAINFLAVNESKRADYYFRKSYKDYVRPPFQVWSETPIGYAGSANFLTGIGGFLQAIINGYGGLRFQRAGKTSIMTLEGARLPPDTKGMIIRGINFAGSKFELTIDAQSEVTLKCTSLGNQSLHLLNDTEGNRQIYQGLMMKLGATALLMATA